MLGGCVVIGMVCGSRMSFLWFFLFRYFECGRVRYGE